VGVHFGLFMDKEIGKGFGKTKRNYWQLFMKLKENTRKGR